MRALIYSTKTPRNEKHFFEVTYQVTALLNNTPYSYCNLSLSVFSLIKTRRKAFVDDVFLCSIVDETLIKFSLALFTDGESFHNDISLRFVIHNWTTWIIQKHFIASTDLINIDITDRLSKPHIFISFHFPQRVETILLKILAIFAAKILTKRIIRNKYTWIHMTS